MMVLDSLPSRCLWIFVLIALIGFLRVLESSIENLNEARMQKLAQEKNKDAKKVLFFTENDAKFYSSVKIINTLCELVLATLTVYSLPAMLFPAMTEASGVVLCSLIVFVLMFIFGVHMPKRIAEIYADGIALKTTPVLYAIYYIGLPFSLLLTAISNVFLLVFGIRPSDTEEEVTEEEIRLMVDIGSESGAIDPEEKEMIHNIFELDDTLVKDIMTHRTDSEILWLEETHDWDKIISETNHSVYPVCKESIDNIIGTLSSSDFYKTRLFGGEIKKNSEKSVFRT
jgi:putative hemolysin